MFRLCLLAAICLANAVAAQETQDTTGADCVMMPYDKNNCVRVVGCLGDEGITIDGIARGWESGTVAVTLSNNLQCSGTWDNGGTLGTGVATLNCTDHLTLNVEYYTLDPLTGTVIGRGQDSLGRRIQAWSGDNVVQFLTPDGATVARLPCTSGNVPLS